MPSRVKLKNLAAATTASVKAALGRPAIIKPGTLAGFLIRDAQLAALGKTPQVLAKEIVAGIRTSSGFKLTPKVQKFPGGALVGYLPPPILLKTR